MGEEITRRTVAIRNVQGLHARPAARFVQVACEFTNCEIAVRKGDETVNGKSIMGLLMLAAELGAELTIEVTGGEHAAAAARLCGLIENKFEAE